MSYFLSFFFNDTATTEIYTLSLHDALPIFDINPYSYAINSSRALDPNVFYTKNYAPFNIHHELANNYMDFDVLDLRVQAELKYKPITKVELAVLGAYKFSNTVQNHQIRDKSNFAMAYRSMADATIRDANPWLYLDPEAVNSQKFSVLEQGEIGRASCRERSVDLGGRRIIKTKNQ